MTVVVDTNVIVSGLLSPLGAPGEVVRLAASGELQLCYDSRLIAEYRAVLARPRFRFDQEYVEALLDQLQNRGSLVTTKPLGGTFPDTDDRAFAEVAVACNAQYLITGNTRHFPEELYGAARVILPADFLNELRQG